MPSEGKRRKSFGEKLEERLCERQVASPRTLHGTERQKGSGEGEGGSVDGGKGGRVRLVGEGKGRGRLGREGEEWGREGVKGEEKSGREWDWEGCEREVKWLGRGRRGRREMI